MQACRLEAGYQDFKIGALLRDRLPSEPFPVLVTPEDVLVRREYVRAARTYSRLIGEDVRATSTSVRLIGEDVRVARTQVRIIGEGVRAILKPSPLLGRTSARPRRPSASAGRVYP